MFTGIVEGLGTVLSMEENGSNIRFRISAEFADEIRIDQSIAHNGVCLTATSVEQDHYDVVAVKETLEKSNLGSLAVGDVVNLERCLKLNDRIDGHIVQGHVDRSATCSKIMDENGSWTIEFDLGGSDGLPLVDKGSVAVNGVSLTVASITEEGFTVAVIPYTFEHTQFHRLSVGDSVNIEFDILGKYIARLIQR